MGSFKLYPRNDTELLTASWSDQVMWLHLSAKGLGCVEEYLGSNTIPQIVSEGMEERAFLVIPFSPVFLPYTPVQA